jgi:antitoxin (DNA-binding transcriptional repressor) of toxin-antitoxin stability system
MNRPQYKGAQDARSQLPALLADAERGRATVITRHGRSVAALVPIGAMAGRAPQKALTALAGSGKGLWGRDSTRMLRRLRDEWGP